MNLIIILPILIIVIGVLLIVATPSVLFNFDWNKKNGYRKDYNDHILQCFALYNEYHLLVYQMKIRR